MSKHLQNYGPNTQEIDPETGTWVAKTHPKTERVWDEASGTWSNRPIVEEAPKPAAKKKAARKKASKKK